MENLKLIVVCTLTIFIQSYVHAQSLPVGTIGVEDYYRRSQLSGAADTNVSFTVRPLFSGQINSDHINDISYSDSNAVKYKLLNFRSLRPGSNKKLQVSLLPFTVQTNLIQIIRMDGMRAQ